MSFGGSGASGSIQTSSDVNLSNPQTGQVLAYDATATKWQNQNVAGGIPAIVSLGNMSGAISLDLSQQIGGQLIFTGTLTGNVTFSLANNPGTYLSVELRLTQGGSGSYTVSAPFLQYANGVTSFPVASSYGSLTIIPFSTVDGINFYCEVA